MFLDCSGGPTLPCESLEVKEDGRRVGQKDATTEKRGTRGGSMREIQPTIAGFEDGRREPAAEECRWPMRNRDSFPIPLLPTPWDSLG